MMVFSATISQDESMSACNGYSLALAFRCLDLKYSHDVVLTFERPRSVHHRHHACCRRGTRSYTTGSPVRSQLLESGRLLAEAQQSFENVTAGFGDAGGTIAGLSARLDQKEKGLKEAERGLRVSRAEVTRLKKVILTENG